MFPKISTSIFVQILLATLLPVILIFSLVIAAISKNFFQSSATAALKETHSFAQQTSEQIRSRFLHNSALTELAAKDLALVAGDSDPTRGKALQIIRNTLKKASGTYRIRVHLLPKKDSLGAEDDFLYAYYHESETINGRRLLPGSQMILGVVPSWCEVPLEKGVPFQDSFAKVHFEANNEAVYVASTNFPILDGGNVIGCVGMDILYQETLQLIDDWRADSSYRMLISGEDGTILSASVENMVGRSLHDLNFDDEYLENMKGAMAQNTDFIDESHSPLSGTRSLIALHPIKLPGVASRLFLYIGTPTELVYREARDSLQLGLLAFLGGLLLFIGSLFAVTRRITNPIEELIAAADLVARGQFDAATYDFNKKYASQNKVGSLRHTLRMMLKKIAEDHKLKLGAMEAEYEKKRLEATAAAKDRFFANMSHEIRTPMNVIYGMTEMLLLEKLTDEQKRYAQDIKVSASSLLNIVNDILDLSRLEAGEFSLVPRHYTFNVLVENVRSLCQYLAGKKRLRFHYETVGDIPDVLYGDDGRLRQVLLNILENAIKFTKQGSVTLKIVEEEETICFTVSDTGIGIKEEDMQYLFAPFKRIEMEKTRHIQGSGLGLSICKRLVNLMGGELVAESEDGKGSTFRITIPKTLGDAAQIKETPHMQQVSFTPGVRVLVVDDSESNLRVAVAFLKRFNIMVDTASSGAACLEMLNKETYNLLFMDHMMPEMDGIETTARIRARGGPFASLPIVVLTANAVAGAREMFLAANMDDFLTKPIEKEKLQAILVKWLPEGSLIRVKEDEERVDQKAENESERSSFIVKAAEVKELDIRLGLCRVADNQELYEDLLGLIVEIIPDALKKVDTALQEGDTTMLVTETHMLKSSLANLGAMELSERMAELERAGSEGDMETFMSVLESLRSALEEFVCHVKILLPEGKNLATLPATLNDTRNLESGLRELRGELDAYNYGKIREMIVDLMRFDWGEDWNRRIETIYSHIKYFDYEAAKGVLDRYFPKQESSVSA